MNILADKLGVLVANNEIEHLTVSESLFKNAQAGQNKYRVEEIRSNDVQYGAYTIRYQRAFWQDSVHGVLGHCAHIGDYAYMTSDVVDFVLVNVDTNEKLIKNEHEFLEFITKDENFVVLCNYDADNVYEYIDMGVVALSYEHYILGTYMKYIGFDEEEHVDSIWTRKARFCYNEKEGSIVSGRVSVVTLKNQSQINLLAYIASSGANIKLDGKKLRVKVGNGVIWFSVEDKFKSYRTRCIMMAE